MTEDKELPLEGWEIKKLRQLICPHDDTEDFIEEWSTQSFPCEHCGCTDQKCNDCGKEVIHKCPCDYGCNCEDDD